MQCSARAIEPGTGIGIGSAPDNNQRTAVVSGAWGHGGTLEFTAVALQSASTHGGR